MITQIDGKTLSELFDKYQTLQNISNEELQQLIDGFQFLYGLASKKRTIKSGHLVNCFGPLGKPKQNSRKYFATVEILQISEDFNWLGKATAAVSENWKEKNANRNKLKTVEGIALGAKLE